MIDYKTSNIKGFRHILIIIDNFSKYLWAIPLKNNYSQTITNEFSIILKPQNESLSKQKAEEGLNFIIVSFRTSWEVKIIRDSQTKVHQ